MSHLVRIAGLILAGGRSRRMGGQDKSFVELAGKPLISHVIDRAVPQVAELAINTNSDDPRYPALGVPVVRDVFDGFQGPLAGLHAGLSWVRSETKADWLATFACDTPLIPDDCVEQLEKVAIGSEAAIAQWKDKRHPTIGLWHKDLLAVVEQWLRKEGRMLMGFVDEIGAAAADFSTSPEDPFVNINEPAELAAAERKLSS